MKKGLTEIVFILDRSGSMAGLETDTIGGYNAMLHRQKQQEGEAFISTVLFDDETDVIFDRVPIDKTEELTQQQYYVRGCTALLDAIGGGIRHIGNIHKYAREEDRPEKTIFIITTDGQENASKKYTYKRIKEMVERQQKEYGWEFLFLGANIDAIAEASKFGIREECAANYECDSVGTKLLYQELSQAVCSYRMNTSERKMDRSWKQNIEEDYQKRTKK